MVDVHKYHGTGNDFVVVDASEEVPDRRGFAVDLCDRTDGIEPPEGATGTTGADGVLFLSLEDQYSPPRVVMTLVQPDGSIAAMCGNGARVAARWVADRTGSDEVMIDTPAGTRRAVLDRETGEVTVEMGRATFDPSSVPVDSTEPFEEREVEGVVVTAVNTGVPHAVAFVERGVEAVDIEAVAPPVRHADVFPEGANVTFAAERDTGGYDQRTFERGVEGETRSCGTGAVAVAAVARRLGRIDTGEPVVVSPPGGDLTVTVTDSGSTLRGPVVFEFERSVPPVAPRRLDDRVAGAGDDD